MFPGISLVVDRLSVVRKLLLPAIAAACAAAFGTAPSAASAEKAAEPIRIAHGAEVDISKYLVEGKTVIFDFTSRYCPPCEAIAPYLHKLHAKLDDLVVVEVDINRPETRGIDWRSPVARQYEMNSIPHFKIFDGSGKLSAEGDPAYRQIVGLIEKHLLNDEG